MEGNDLVTVAESSNGTLNDLPYDVLRELFSYVSTEELISVWRLVSNKWSHLASDFCRQRSVTLRLPRNREIFTAPIAHLFTDVDNLPFSEAILKLDSSTPELHAFSDYVAERFGEHFKSAQVTTHLLEYRAFFETLRRTPNLVTLEIFPKSEGREDTEEDFRFTYEKIELPALKSLTMVYDAKGHFMSIMEMCFRQLAPQLEFIDLELDTGSIRGAEFNRCAQLIVSQNFPKMSLCLPLKPEYFDGWRILVAKGPFEIQTLVVTSREEETEELDMTFDLLGPFLGNCHGLTSLTLDGFEKGSLTSKRCQVPAMPTLKKLTLTEVFNDEEDGQPSCKFEPFNPRFFPSLTEVVMGCEAYYGDAIDLRLIFDVREERFLGVTSLDVGSTPSETHWASLFPSVKTLSASMRNAKQFEAIFTNMAQVTELDLQLSKGIFFGLPQHIRSLKKLKTLTLRLEVLGDEAAVFATLSPLNLKIVYSKYELGDYCLAQLRSRHDSVELLMEEDD